VRSNAVLISTARPLATAFILNRILTENVRIMIGVSGSENVNRVAAMQRADENIDDRLEDLNRTLHRLRQNSIEEELIDVVSGFEALTPKGSR